MPIQTQKIYLRKPQVNPAFGSEDVSQSYVATPSYTSGLKGIADKRYIESFKAKNINTPSALTGINTTPVNTSLNTSVSMPSLSSQFGMSNTDLSTFNLGNSQAGNLSLGEYKIHEPLTDTPYNYIDNEATASAGKTFSSPLSTAMFGISQGIQSVANIRNQNTINEPDDYKAALKAYGEQQYYGDYADLYQQGLNRGISDMPTYEDIRGKSKGEVAGDILSAGLQGGMSGLTTGNPWLGLVGSALGTLTSGIGAISGKNRAKQALKELDALKQTSDYKNQKQYQYGIDNAVLRNQYNLKGNIFSMGGFFPTGIEEINEGGTHEQNPLGGIPLGIDAEGNPNLVEEGEVIFNDYVFSNRLTMPDNVRRKYKFGNKKGMTFADAASNLRKKYEERPNDPITKLGIMDQLSSLIAEQEMFKENLQMDVMKNSNKYALGGNISPEAEQYILGLDDTNYQNFVNELNTMPNAKKTKALTDRDYLFKYANSGKYGPVANAINNNYLDSLVATQPQSLNAEASKLGQYTYDSIKPTQIPEFEQTTHVGDPNYRQEDAGYATWMRYAPVVGAGINVLTDLAGLTNTPDYKDVNAITEAAYNSTRNPDIDAVTIGNYLQYKPLDTAYLANRAAAQSSATRQALQQNANGNRAMAMAGLLSADRNAQNAMGDLYRQAEEYNAQQRAAVEGFNRGTNQYNADNMMKARIANKQDKASQYHLLYDAAVKKAALKAQIDAQASAGRSANLTNLFNSLGDIGRENMAYNMVNSQNALYYSIDKRGNVKYTNAFYKLPKNEQDEIRKEVNSNAEEAKKN